MNGQYPEQMYSFIKDILFMEQLKDDGFDATYSLTVVNDKNFYSGKKTDGIYRYFRDGERLCKCQYINAQKVENNNVHFQLFL